MKPDRILYALFIFSCLILGNFANAQLVIKRQEFRVQSKAGDTLIISPTYFTIEGYSNLDDVEIECLDGNNYQVVSKDRILINESYAGELKVKVKAIEAIIESPVFLFKADIINTARLRFNNAGFENGNTDTWSVRNELQHSIETGEVAEGNYSIKLWYDDNNDVGGRMRTKGTNYLDIIKGYTYELVFYAKVDKDSASLDAALTIGGNDPVDGHLENFMITQEWTKFSYRLIADTTVTFGVTFNNFCKGYNYFIDNVYVNEYPKVSEPIKIGNLYVSSANGDDTNSGSIDSPFKTVYKAIESIEAGGIIYLREGRYHENLLIDQLNGTESFPIEISNFNNEQVLIDGTIPLEGNWEVYDGDIMKIQLEQDIQQLWVNKKMMPAARWPNVRGNFTDDFNFEYTSREPEPGTNWDIDANYIDLDIPYTHVEGDKAYWKSIGTDMHSLAQTGIDFTGGMIAIKMGYETVGEEILSHSAGSNQFETTVYNEGEITKKTSKSMYFITSHLACLDKPGEWYFDLDTKILYLWPEEGVNLNNSEVRGKVQKLAMTITNSSDLTIRGLNFYGTTIKGLDSKNLLIEDCVFDYPNYVPWMLKEKYPQFGLCEFAPAFVTIRNCEYRYFDGTAIYLNGNEIATPVLENCLFHNSRYDHMVRFLNCKGAYARRNTLYVSERGNGFKYYKSPQGQFVAELNYMHNLASHRSDASCIQVQSGSQELDTLRYNWFHDTDNKGIRFDGEPAGQLGTMFSNVGWDLWQGLQVKGDYQTVVNNTFFDCGKRCDITILSDDRFGGNKHSKVYNNAAERMSGHRVRDVAEHPIECENSNNWNGFITEVDISSILRDPANLDFRPKKDAPLIDAARQVENVTRQNYNGEALDIGAYEFGDINYWIPGRQIEKASMPVPPDGTLTAQSDCDLMWLGAYNGTSHRVYLGTNPDNLNMVSEQENNIYFTGGLSPNTVYLWRVDELVDGKISKGDVWYFVTNGKSSNETKLPVSYFEDFNKSEDDANFEPWDENIWDHHFMKDDSTYVVEDKLVVWPSDERSSMNNKFRLTDINMILRPHPLMGMKYQTPPNTDALRIAINVVSKGAEGNPVFFDLASGSSETLSDTIINIKEVFEEWDKKNPDMEWGHLEQFDIWFYPENTSLQNQDSLIVDDFALGFQCIDLGKCELKIANHTQPEIIKAYPNFIGFENLEMILVANDLPEPNQFTVVDMDALPGTAKIIGQSGESYNFENQILTFIDTSLYRYSIPIMVESGYLKSQWYDFVIDLTPAQSKKIRNEQSLTIYPNPVQDVLFFSEHKGIERMEIYDMSGSKIMSCEIHDNNVNLSTLKNGLYLCIIYAESGISHKQILKK